MPTASHAVPLSFAITASPGPASGARDPEGNDALETLARDGVNQIRLPRIRHEELEGRSPGNGPLPETIKEVDDQLERARRVTEATGEPMYVAVNPGDLTAPERDSAHARWLDYVIERYKHHPALGVWKFYDEPNNPYNPYEKVVRVREGLRRAHARVHELDGRHLTWITQAPKPKDRITERFLSTYLDACDIHAVDVYPVSDPPGRHSDLPNKLPSCVGDYADRFASTARAASRPDAPKWVWMVLQGAAWSGVIPRDEKRRPQGPMLMQPPAHMFRYMTYQSIIHGAEGIVIFGMGYGLHPDMAPHGWDWGYWRNAVVPTIKELHSGDLHAALAVRQSERAVRHSLGERGVRIDTLTVAAPGGERFLLASRGERKRGEPREAEVEIPAHGPRGAETIKDRFAPHDVRVYALGR
ncbi:MAG TPA: hypothetical protein VFX49_00600 [Chloroflexota bacterium]|nr:hypothetical protein [Chloroflexota bacterium]